MSLRAGRSRSVADTWKPPRVAGLRAGSPGEGKVRPGDLLLEINGKPPLDIIDYMDYSEGERVALRLLRDGKEIRLKIRKRRGVPLGLLFDEAVFDAVRTCCNQCIFCFVDQMPKGMRPTLYIKDDDYRLSFYFGNFITLNNLSREDMARIKRLRLSPLYVSLHSTDPVLREHIMGGEAAAGLDRLRSLLDAGLQIHAQVVVCPGINDGDELARTLHDVMEGYGVASLGVVPVGLSSHSRALPQEIRAHDRDSATAVIETIDEYQAKARDRHGRRIFFASDEFYLLAAREFPAEDEYGGYPQLENGIGMARKFLQEVREESAHFGMRGKPGRGVITGMAGAEVIKPALEKAGVDGVEIIAVKNRLLGARIVVTALLGGTDIITALREMPPASRELLIPDSMLRGGLFIDDLSPAVVARETGYLLVPTEVEGGNFLRKLYGEGEAG